jgi:hypothetical protein
MAQHDYSIANATGLDFRTDINNALAAIVTTNAGATAPTATFAGMFWLDMSAGGDGVVRRRNAANSAWISDVGVDQVARDAAAAAQTTANAALPKAGGTMTGAIVLPNAEPTGHQAVSRTQADALYQVLLPTPIAGSLLLGAAGGWQSQIAPGATNTLLTISGGLPIWQATAVSATPNSVVRTLSDGTIDPSFIPSVASGLRFCGTFKPVVNDEYPTTGDGGHGAGGAPVVGDFWVIDGLTTGGYTYLTGSLAGVMVINGDSIAYNGAGTWYKMGSSVSLAGYLKTDGSTAMAGALNMGSFAINNAGGLAGRAGTPVPQTNFRIDATNIVISPQRGVSGADLASMAAGQIGTDLGRAQIYVGTASVNTPMLAVPFFSTTATYAVNDYVKNGTGLIYRAKGTIAAGAFTASQWAALLDTDGTTLNGPIRIAYGAGIQFNNNLNGNIGYTQSVGGTGSAEVLQLYGHNDAGAANALAAMTWRRSDNLITVQSLLSNGTVIADNINTAIGGSGYVALRRSGVAGTPGYVGWYHGDNTRWGFIGTGTSNLLMTAEGTHGWTIDGANIILAGPTSVQSSLAITATMYFEIPAGTRRYYTSFDDFRLNWNIFSDAGAYQSTPLAMVRKWAAGAHVALSGCVVTGDLDCCTGTTTGVLNFGTALTGRMNFSGTQFVFSHACTGPAFTPSSDRRLKSNLRTREPRNFDALPFYDFVWSATGQPDSGTTAQDAAEIAPEYVGGEEGHKTLNVAALALEAVLNVARRVAALEAKLNEATP